jgi:hypothetical protein
MTHTALPFFLIPSCIAHSALLLQPEQTRTFADSSAAATTLQVRIVSHATKPVKNTALKIDINTLPEVIQLLQGNALTVQNPAHFKLLGG